MNELSGEGAGFPPGRDFIPMFGPRNFCASTATQLILIAAAAGLVFFAPASASAQDSPSTPAPAASTSARPKLAGSWTLNKDLSDDPRQKMQQAMGNSGGQGEGGEGGQGGGGGWQGRRGGGGPGGPGGGRTQDMDLLTITQSDASVKIMSASGRLLTQTSDEVSSNPQSSNQSDSGNRPRFAPPVAQWQGNQLVSVMEGRRGGKTTRTYELSPDGSQLIVTTKIENERFNNPVVIRQVYDQSKAGAPPPSQ